MPWCSVRWLYSLQKQHHLDALPEGWFYNGRDYVSMDGQRSSRHPGKLLLPSSLDVTCSCSSYCVKVAPISVWLQSIHYERIITIFPLKYFFRMLCSSNILCPRGIEISSKRVIWMYWCILKSVVPLWVRPYCCAYGECPPPTSKNSFISHWLFSLIYQQC